MPVTSTVLIDRQAKSDDRDIEGIGFSNILFQTRYGLRYDKLSISRSQRRPEFSKEDDEQKSENDRERERFCVGFELKMANADVMRRTEEIFQSPVFDSVKDNEKVISRGQMIERKIELLENLSVAGKVSNRRSRRWLNDRLLIELVPCLSGEEIRGLFAPPPWGDYKPVSAFSMANDLEWDSFRNIDMDTEARIIKALATPTAKRKDRMDNDKTIALNAWHRVDCRTREALRRNFLSDHVQGYEECIRAFIRDSGDVDVLVLRVQDAFHRLLLHGVCEFYDLISVTVTKLEGAKLLKMTRITKKKSGSQQIPPNITLTSFVKMAKDGVV